jgi:uncharacterized protein YjiS (DUF1127 family)
MSDLVVEASVPPEHAGPTLREELRSRPFEWVHAVSTWIARRRQRRALIALDDRLLADIGVSREQALRQAAKPFWKT